MTLPPSPSAPASAGGGDLTDLVEHWPADSVAVAVTTPTSVVADGGFTASGLTPVTWVSRLASITKLFTAWAALVAVEEGTIALDDEAGPADSTVRHLLAHASGYAFNAVEVLAKPRTRRIYSNVGIEALADHLAERSGIAFPRYLHEAVFEPLGMTATELRGSPAADGWSNVMDLTRFAREVMRPTLVSAVTRDLAVKPQFPHLAGVLPGFGRQEPNSWGLGFEIRGTKEPHWTGSHNSERTVGHFGGAGTFLWIDPERDLAVACITDREFGPWAAEVWPTFSDAVIDRMAATLPEAEFS